MGRRAELWGQGRGTGGRGRDLVVLSTGHPSRGEVGEAEGLLLEVIPDSSGLPSLTWAGGSLTEL